MVDVPGKFMTLAFFSFSGSSLMVTERSPWAMATLEMVTSLPITTVPVFSFITILAIVSGITESVSISAINSATFFCHILSGTLKLNALASMVLATPSPIEALMVSVILFAVVKSGRNKERINFLFPSSLKTISCSTDAPLAIRPT